MPRNDTLTDVKFRAERLHSTICRTGVIAYKLHEYPERPLPLEEVEYLNRMLADLDTHIALLASDVRNADEKLNRPLWQKLFRK